MCSASDSEPPEIVNKIVFRDIFLAQLMSESPSSHNPSEEPFNWYFPRSQQCHFSSSEVRGHGRLLPCFVMCLLFTCIEYGFVSASLN